MLRVAVFENLQRQVVAGLGRVGFLDDLDAACAVLPRHESAAASSALSRSAIDVVQRPAALGARTR